MTIRGTHGDAEKSAKPSALLPRLSVTGPVTLHPFGIALKCGVSMAAPDRKTSMKGVRISTGWRLGATFAAVLALFAVALLVVLPAMGELERADRDVAAVDRAKHSGHRVAALVREQYIHQAHTIIEGNRSHLGHYRDIAETTRKATGELAGHAVSDEERALASQISAMVAGNDDDFMRVTLPAIDRGEHDEVVRLHGETEIAVADILKLVRQLNERFESRSDAARVRAERERRRVRVTTLACFGAAALLAALAAILTTRLIARRVSALREGARRVGDGDLSRRIGLTGNDELAELADAFDDMAARLHRHQQDLVQSQKLASIGRLCAGVAHEINGPLGIILGYAKVIRKQGVDEEALRAIEDETKQCQRIVQALLDMSRQETPRFAPVDLVQLARDGVDRLRATGILKGRDVIVDDAGAPVIAFGDETKLRQVVLNLLTNAAEATPEGGTIRVEAGLRDARAVLSVVDDGPGIPAATKARLFEPFFTTKDEGTGLGLAISRAIVEAHRGEIRFDAREKGGTRVEVRLESAPDAVEAFA